MSRNLNRGICAVCECDVVICGEPYLKTFDNSRLVAADATCTCCGAKYTAWISETIAVGGETKVLRCGPPGGFFDLSYRSTFNDEPGPDDVPAAKVEVWRVVKVGDAQHWFPWYLL